MLKKTTRGNNNVPINMPVFENTRPVLSKGFGESSQQQRLMREDRVSNRNNPDVYPFNVNVDGVGNFRITEVIADGRCLFGSIWLLSQNDETIRRIMSDPFYTELEEFIGNDRNDINAKNVSKLNNYIRETISLSGLEICNNLKLMSLYYADKKTDESNKFRDAYWIITDDFDVVSELYCVNNESETEHQKELLSIANKLYQSGVAQSFNNMLKTYYTPILESNISKYAEADLSFFGNTLSDKLGLEIHLVKSQPNYKPPYVVDSNSIFRGSNTGAKKKIYLYFKQDDQSGHFQAMIPTSILANSSTKSNLNTLIEMGFSKEKAEEALNHASDDFTFALEILREASANRGTSRVSSFDSADSLNYNDSNTNNELDRVQGEKNACLAEKKTLFEYFTFPKKLKIKYVSPNNRNPTDLPSTGTWGSFTGKTSTTDRIKGGEKSDNVYSKVAAKFTNLIQKVEISNGLSIVNQSTDYMKATEDWYFLVTLEGNPVPVTKGGRTQKRQQKRGGRRRSSQKKRKTHTRRRLTKRRQLPSKVLI
jgi:hypothetical protein